MKKFDIALIGLGVMGQSLARNLASRKLRVLTYNRHADKARNFIEKFGNDYLDYRNNLMMLTEELESPRKIILMVPAGKPVDDMINELMPFISNGDIIIDAGNSLYSDTIRRHEALQKKDINYVGMGVSGGEEGALRGPSIMVGSENDVWKEIKPALQKIAAKDFSGKPCVAHIGTDGAGHFVKMVHNGIEYAVMQLMAEAYQMLKQMYALDAGKISKIFDKYNKGKLKSYLFEISAEVLARKDELSKKGFLVDHILNKAGQKGTGRWTVIESLLKGSSVPTISEAVFARSISSLKDERVSLNKLYKFKKTRVKISLPKFTKLLENALYAGMISSYAQGFELIRVAAEEQKWKIDFAEISRIWEGGCIIRAELLNFLHKAFSKSTKPANMFAMTEIKKAMTAGVPSLAEVVSAGAMSGISIPAMSASLNYFRSMTSDILPANFIQGLRDYFGAHTYERTDKEGVFHTQWSDLIL